jgi:hypothetical protein
MVSQITMDEEERRQIVTLGLWIFSDKPTNTNIKQQVIPGGIIPGGGNNYDKETDGISCYTCDSCNKEPFDAEVYGVGTKSGCYMCVKAWDDGKWLYLRILKL